MNVLARNAPGCRSPIFVTMFIVDRLEAIDVDHCKACRLPDRLRSRACAPLFELHHHVAAIGEPASARSVKEARNALSRWMRKERVPGFSFEMSRRPGASGRSPYMVSVIQSQTPPWSSASKAR